MRVRVGLLVAVAAALAVPVGAAAAPLASCRTFPAAVVAQAQGVADRARPSVVVIETDRGGGTGFFVLDDRHVLTNNHVVEGATSIDVWLLDGRRFGARVVATTASPDAALLLVDAPTGAVPLPIGSSTTLKPGDPLVAVGNPGGVGNWVATLGAFFTTTRTSSGPGTPLVRVVETTVPGRPGSSGSPILDRSGRVVALAYGGTGDLVGKVRVSSPQVRTYLASERGLNAHAIEEALAAVRTVRLATGPSVGGWSTAVKKPPKPKKRKPPKVAAPTGPLFNCRPAHGAGWDAETLARAQRVVNDARPSVVLVQDDGFGIGTGFFVADGVVMTNNHVVDGARALSIRLLDGRQFGATVIGRTENPDVALLRVAGSPVVRPLPVGSSATVEPGEPLVAIGSPGDALEKWVPTVGRFRGLEAASAWPGEDVTSDVPAASGSSGSPILDLDGKVVALLWGGRGFDILFGAAPAPAAPAVRTFIVPQTAATLAARIEDAVAVARSLGVAIG